MDVSEPRICPPMGSETRIGILALKTEMDEKQWVRLPAIRCVATKSGKTTSVLRKGEALLEDGLRVWHPGDDDPIQAMEDNVGGANLPIDGGGTGAINGRN